MENSKFKKCKECRHFLNNYNKKLRGVAPRDIFSSDGGYIWGHANHGTGGKK